MDFYYVSSDFIDYLQDVERKAREFTRVPNIEYDSNQNPKFFVGVVFQINKFKYFAPMSHFKAQKPNNVLINITTDKKNPIKGSIRLNYMFPVLDKYLTRVEINKIADEKYKRLVKKELDFCKNNKVFAIPSISEVEEKIKNHKNIIQSVALQTYLNVILGIDSDLSNNACDFRLLESALNNPPSLREETEDSDKGLTLVK